jgi:prophage tail gpP-like protein
MTTDPGSRQYACRGYPGKKGGEKGKREEKKEERKEKKKKGKKEEMQKN